MLFSLPPSSTNAIPKAQVTGMWRSLLPSIVPKDGLAKPQADIREWDDRHGVRTGEICRAARAEIERYYTTIKVLRKVAPDLVWEAESMEQERSHAFHERAREERKTEDRKQVSR